MLTVLVYSSDSAVRDRIRMALGSTPDLALGPLAFVETADGKATVATLDAGGVDVCVLDGEAWPTGGLGLARQMKDELDDPPATVVVVGRPDDRWLARWSRAEAVISHPIDPFELTEAVVRLLHERVAVAAPVIPVEPQGFGVHH